LKHRDKWFSVADVHQFLYDIGVNVTRGTLRNILWRLRSRGFLESRRSSFAEYHLLRIPHEPHPMVGGSNLRPMVVRFGFAEYLESLSWEDLRNVHNVHLKASVRSLSFINKDWRYCKGQNSFSRNELVDNRYRITLTVFSRVRTWLLS
jgi:hypothetical protein